MRSPNASIARPSLSCDPVLTSGRNRVAKVSNKVVTDPTPARSYCTLELLNNDVQYILATSG